ncbi:MAG: DUF262 domain-containing protein [Spirochaeta sp.]|jgi:hypothetical protein|nr:DUF262 domain-containing protein [Spirochaeta sp.]
MSDYEKPITIIEAIKRIDKHELLLPAIQRKFVWSTSQIELLFDSLMQGYPINTFMFWDVHDQEIVNSHRFYGFISDFRERFGEENPEVHTKGVFHPFHAVIDGQQRLTALYLGLKGTYAYKLPRQWWPSTYDEEKLPPRSLYINLVSQPDDTVGTRPSPYQFRFLTKKQYEQSQADSDIHWFPVGDILAFPDSDPSDLLTESVLPYLIEHDLATSGFSPKTLLRLHEIVFRKPVINYYNETHQELDHVLDVFIRTNSGGTKLSFSDLLMSITISQWDEGDARKVVDDLVKQVGSAKEMGFTIDRDWVLKTCLAVLDKDLRFRVKNFDSQTVAQIQENWARIRRSIVGAFTLFSEIGMTDASLRSKNAVIPIVYYLYASNTNSIPDSHTDNRAAIARWLHMSLLQGVFGGQSDTLLAKLRATIRDNLSHPTFPLKAIVTAFTGTTKDLRFDEEFLQRLMETEYGDGRCRSILSLLMPAAYPSQQTDIDHLHPKSAFGSTGSNQDPATWNTIPNLHLIPAGLNKSKNDTPLEEWIGSGTHALTKADLLIPAGTSLKLEDFPAFVEARRSLLLERIKKNIVMTG